MKKKLYSLQQDGKDSGHIEKNHSGLSIKGKFLIINIYLYLTCKLIT